MAFRKSSAWRPSSRPVSNFGRVPFGKALTLVALVAVAAAAAVAAVAVAIIKGLRPWPRHANR